MTGKSAYITDIAAFLPNQPVGNDDMERMLGQVGARPSRARRTVLRSNGITQRYYAIDAQTLQPNYTNASMTAAAVRALDLGELSLADVEALCCGTSIPDQVIPNHAAMVQGPCRCRAAKQ